MSKCDCDTQMHTLASSLTSLWITQTDTELFDSLRVTMMPNMRDQKQQEWLRLKTVVCRCHDPSQHSMSVIVLHSTHTHTHTHTHSHSTTLLLMRPDEGTTLMHSTIQSEMHLLWPWENLI